MVRMKNIVNFCVSFLLLYQNFILLCFVIEGDFEAEIFIEDNLEWQKCQINFLYGLSFVNNVERVNRKAG